MSGTLFWDTVHLVQFSKLQHCAWFHLASGHLSCRRAWHGDLSVLITLLYGLYYQLSLRGRRQPRINVISSCSTNDDRLVTAQPAWPQMTSTSRPMHGRKRTTKNIVPSETESAIPRPVYDLRLLTSKLFNKILTSVSQQASNLSHREWMASNVQKIKQQLKLFKTNRNRNTFRGLKTTIILSWCMSLLLQWREHC